MGEAAGHQATRRLRLLSSLMSPAASSWVKASGLRLKTRKLIASTAPGSSPLAWATLPIASSWRGVAAPLLLRPPLPGRPPFPGRLPLTGAVAGGGGAGAVVAGAATARGGEPRPGAGPPPPPGFSRQP